MKKNLGSADRIVRLILAAVFGILFYAGVISGVIGTILLVLAGVFVITSFVSFCPIYAIFGLSTCEVNPSKE